ncbi:MAG: hypothetical protein IKZ86_07600 [Spirochaetaceae bacterium]|nr:hypothetical protein [Spirochaetaceae bacterium]
MKRKIIFILFLLVGPILFCEGITDETSSVLTAEKMPKKLVSEDTALSSDGEARYWEFTVPNYSNYIEIECISRYGLIYAAVVPSKKDAFSFCNGYDFQILTGSEMGGENAELNIFERKPFEKYYKKLRLEQGKTYYFCVYSPSLLFGNNNILVEITAY